MTVPLIPIQVNNFINQEVYQDLNITSFKVAAWDHALNQDNIFSFAINNQTTNSTKNVFEEKTIDVSLTGRKHKHYYFIKYFIL